MLTDPDHLIDTMEVEKLCTSLPIEKEADFSNSLCCVGGLLITLHQKYPS